MTTGSVVRVRGLGAHTADAVLLADVDLDLAAGTVLAVLGESGAGKSTLGGALAGAAAPGVVLSGEIRATGRVALLPQHPAAMLDPVRRIRPVLDELAAVHHQGRAERGRAVAAALATAGLAPGLGRRFPHQLSGGQQQRAALAMALVTEPAVLVLDEPTTGLDPAATAETTAGLARLVARGTAVVLLTHDLAVAGALADDTIVLDRGRVVRRGGPVQVPVAPEPERTAAGPPPTAGLVASGLVVRTRSGAVLLDDVGISAAAGRIHAVVGRSGAGKTTLGRVLAGLTVPDAGTVTVDGVVLPAAVADRAGGQRRLVQYVHQDARSSFLTHRAVLDQVARPGVLLGGLAPERALGRARELLERLGVAATTAVRRPGGLSGGQLQRAALARALLADPVVLVCDEVTSALDAAHRQDLLAVLDEQRHARGTAVVLVSHDRDLVAAVADEITVLDDGRIAAPTRESSPASVRRGHSRPASPTSCARVTTPCTRPSRRT